MQYPCVQTTQLRTKHATLTPGSYGQLDHMPISPSGLKDDYGEVIAAATDPYAAWTMLESSYGPGQSGIQVVINAELTLESGTASPRLPLTTTI